MKGSDKFLIGIVVGVAVILVAALALIYSQPEPSYLIGDTPDDVVHNYLLALQKSDYEKAYSYLSPDLPGYPLSAREFEIDLERNRYSENTLDLAIVSTEVKASRAYVLVRETVHYQGDIFSSNQYSSEYEFTLILVNDEWKITDAGPYFAYCWNDLQGCQ